MTQAKTVNVTFSEYVDFGETNRNDFEIVDVIDWEFDTPIPSWLQKAMNQHKLLTSQTDPSERFKLAKNPKIAQDFLSETEFLELNVKISSALNIGNSMGDWTVLRPVAERCLQFLSKLDSNELRKIGELVNRREFTEQL
ncbi:9558_t:CDS:2 [Paraglomus occultum]|uniref:9558_t:CDS:1 n=1 Tax=Paraglomus occultum TaxID=144539 RepID=A0A9N8Z0H5_9GLOM|nr:9558_t:CDS:2 [Paraglomus occultum]